MYFPTLLAKVPSTKPLILILDSLDQLTEDGMLNNFSFPLKGEFNSFFFPLPFSHFPCSLLRDKALFAMI